MNELDLYIMGWAFELYIAAAILLVLAVVAGLHHVATHTGLIIESDGVRQHEWYVGRVNLLSVRSGFGNCGWAINRVSGHQWYVFMGRGPYLRITWLLPDEARIQKAAYKALLKADENDHSAL